MIALGWPENICGVPKKLNNEKIELVLKNYSCFALGVHLRDVLTEIVTVVMDILTDKQVEV